MLDVMYTETSGAQPRARADGGLLQHPQARRLRRHRQQIPGAQDRL